MKQEDIRTDLILEQPSKNKKKVKETLYGEIKVMESEDDKGNYTTIQFEDITDKTSFHNLQKIFQEELQKYIKPNKSDIYMIVGLGNEKSTPDSLGPKTLKEILVTRYLFSLGDVEEGYSNVSIIKPDVFGNTGIESLTIVKSVIDEIHPTKIIAIDALKAGHVERLAKTIQITNTGIHPGSGILNNQGELSKQTIHCDVIAIGIPTVVDMSTITKDIQDFMVTPTNIDFVIEKLSYLIGDTINKIVHNAYLRQIRR